VHRWPRWIPAAVAGFLAAVSCPARAQSPPPAQRAEVHSAYELETMALVLGSLGQTEDPHPEAKLVERIEVVPLDVFEPRDPPGLLWKPLTGILNSLHATTRPSIVRSEVLLREGGPYRQVLVDETIRNLRQLAPLSLVLVAPIVSFAVSNFQRLIALSTHRAQQRIADLTANLSETLHGQRVVKSFGREQFEVDRFRRRNDDFFGAYMKLTQFIQTQPLVVSTIMVAAVVAIMWLSVREVLVGRLDTGKVFMYWGLLVNLMNPMNRVAAFFGDISKAIVGAGRVFELLDLPVEVGDPPDAIALPAVRGRIEYVDVTFGYKAGEPPALRGVNATIEAGEIVALVGPSGAGKTTLVNLVPRFYQPQEGVLRIDGVDIAKARLSDLRAAIAIVPQDVQLFRATILENIRYGRIGASDDEVRAAARDGNVDEYVRGFPEGYATEVGERGVRLSGGERQRIAIARAVLRNPRILILDEATSALDSHSETLIEEALDRLLPGRTTLIIAHRLSTIRRAHKVLFIEAGRVVEMGTHDELLSKGGPYARLHAAQFAAIRPGSF